MGAERLLGWRRETKRELPMASLLFSPSRLPTSLFSTLALFIYSPNPHRHHSQSLSSNKTPTKDRALIVSSALAESNSSKSLDGGGRGEGGSDDDDLLPLLRELSVRDILPNLFLYSGFRFFRWCRLLVVDALQDCLLLPPDYLSSLPRDLRLDVSEGDLFLRSDNAMICVLVFLFCEVEWCGIWSLQRACLGWRKWFSPVC